MSPLTPARVRPPSWLEQWHAATWRGPLLVPMAADRAALAAVPDPDDVPDESGALREVAGLAVPWRVPMVRWGLRVMFTPETTSLPDPLDSVKLLVQHDDERPIGWATRADFTETGLDASFAVPVDHPRVAEAMADLDAKLRDGLSVGVELDPETLEALFEAMWDGQAEDDEPISLGALVRETSLVSVPQFVGARVHNSVAPGAFPAVGAVQRFAAERTITMPPAPAAPVTMNRPPDSSPSSPAAATAGVPASPPPAGTPADHAEPISMAELAAQLAPFLSGVAGSAHPLAGFSSLGEFVLAGRETGARDAEGERLTLALADQITGNNPGVLPPTWLTEVVGIIDRGRPAVTAFGGPGDAGDSGMGITWPYYDGDLEALVNEQAAQKTEVTTGRVDIKSGTANLKTYAGASDISYQLLRRSSPSYREIYSRILALAFSARTNAVFSADLVAIATAGEAWDGTTAESLLAAIFAASDEVDNATGSPASVALASPDMFRLIGAGLGLYPPQYGTQNVPGTSEASTLRVSVSGLVIQKNRHFADGTVIVSNPSAARWREDGPFVVEADDVAVLGRDVGIWGMGVTTVTVPAGIISVGVTPPVPLSKSSK